MVNSAAHFHAKWMNPCGSSFPFVQDNMQSRITFTELVHHLKLHVRAAADTKIPCERSKRFCLPQSPLSIRRQQDSFYGLLPKGSATPALITMIKINSFQKNHRDQWAQCGATCIRHMKSKMGENEHHTIFFFSI